MTKSEPLHLNGNEEHGNEGKAKLVALERAYQRPTWFNETFRNYGMLTSKAVIPTLDLGPSRRRVVRKV